MTVTTVPTKQRTDWIANRLRERSDELMKFGSQIEETDDANAQLLYEASQHLDDAAYILEELKLA